MGNLKELYRREVTIFFCTENAGAPGTSIHTFHAFTQSLGSLGRFRERLGNVLHLESKCQVNKLFYLTY